MRSFNILFVTLACAVWVTCDPIPTTSLNKEEIKSSMATASLGKQLESGDIKNYDANLYLDEDLEGVVGKTSTSLTDDESTAGKRAARQVVVTASFPYAYFPYAYYPSVYTAARINYYRAAIFPFLGI